MISQVTLEGVRLAYADEGRGAPLVLVHGFPFDHTMWAAQVARFAPRWRVIATSMRRRHYGRPSASFAQRWRNGRPPASGSEPSVALSKYL